MKRNFTFGAVVVALLLSIVSLLLALSSCELGPFHCEGQIPGQGPLCYCDATGLLCGHDGFAPCSACPSEGE